MSGFKCQWDWGGLRNKYSILLLEVWKSIFSFPVKWTLFWHELWVWRRDDKSPNLVFLASTPANGPKWSIYSTKAVVVAIWKDESPVEIAIEKVPRSQPAAATLLSSNGGLGSFRVRPITLPRTNLEFKDVLKIYLLNFNRISFSENIQSVTFELLK